MNLLQVLTTTLRLYSTSVGWYLFAGLLLFLSSLVGLGLFCCSLLASMVLASPFGEEGQWLHNPPAALLIFGCLGMGALCASAVRSASAGAFVHLCAQIGSGRREITLLGYLEYGKRNGIAFWTISLVRWALELAAMSPFILVAALFGPVWAPLAVVMALFCVGAFVLAQWPLWLAFSAQAVERRGVMASIRASLYCARRAPGSGLAAVLILGAAMLIAAPMLVFYPLYFFFVFMPLSTVMGLVYYESSRGMLKR